MASCTNPIYVNTTNVLNFGFSTTFDTYLKSILFDITGYTEFQTGGEANISQINFVVTNPQENVFTGSIDPSNSETQLNITGLTGGLLYFGTYHIKGTLVEADASTYDIEFDIEVCDNNILTTTNYVKGCINAEANCLTARLTITDDNHYYYNGITAQTDVSYDAKMWIPNDPDGGLEEFTLPYLPYVKNLSGYFTGNYQISVTSVAYYDLGCGAEIAITYKSALTKTIDCTASICELNCCWSDSLEIANGGGQKAGQMQQKMIDAEPYYLSAMGKYICGKNAQSDIDMVNEILGCSCTCRQYIIQPAPITIGNSNVIGECGTAVTTDENGDTIISSFIYEVKKGDPTDLAFIFTTTTIGECTKRTTITFNYDVMQANILNSIANNAQYISNWQDVLGINGCPCDGVEISNGSELLTLNKANNDFSTLVDNYFVKNDIITGVEYDDITIVTGGTASHVKYTDQIIQQAGIATPSGNITLPCGVCGGGITDLTGYKLIKEVNTTCSCVEVFECDLETPKVDFSERYGGAYRFNPQMDSPCYTTYSEVIDGNLYTMTKVYFGDLEFGGTLSLTSSSIRVLILKTDNVGNTTFHETRTIIGNNFGDLNTPTTNNTWGDQVALNRPSAVNLDFDEIVNGEPVLYFSTVGGYICRAVRERSSECDERANWKVYVIFKSSKALYGMKKFILDENGNRSFIFYNFTESILMSLTYDNTGSKNNSANWSVNYIDIDLVSVGGNFNIDGTTIYTYGTNEIKEVTYIGTTALASIANPASYSESVICDATSISATSYIDGVSSLATIAEPTWMQKVVVGAEDRFYFGNTDSDVTNSYIKLSYVRYMVKDLEGIWTFYTDIVSSNYSILDDGTWNPDVSTTANGASQGIIEIADLGCLSIFLHGVKVFDFVNHTIRNLSGQATAGGNLAINNYMDTQYSYELSNCEGGSGV
jgi:hypothetical protein